MAFLGNATLLDRLATKFTVGDGCWKWNAATNQYGYGVIGRGGRGAGNVLAHRLMYELLVGPIPEGLDLDHLCRNRWCVRPSHLEPVTRQTNLLRGAGIVAEEARRTHCPQGHQYVVENTYTDRRNHRHCKTCHRDRERRRYRERER